MRENWKAAIAMLLGLGFYCLAYPVFSQSLNRHVVSSTPYDPYLDTFNQVAAQSAGSAEITMDKVEKLTKEASRIPYEHVDGYRCKSPSEVDVTGSGDCKDKALWLFAKLKAAGAANLHMVIGKKDVGAREFHAWLYLTLNNRIYLLDPTFRSSVWEAADFQSDEYIPIYSYNGNQAYAYDQAENVSYTSDPRYQTPVLSAVAAGD